MIIIDQVIGQLLSQFSADHEVTGLEESERFESFALYCVLSGYTFKSFAPDDFRIGGGGDGGIDGFAVVVDEKLFRDPIWLERYLATVNNAAAHVVVVQAKNESHTNRGNIADLRIRVDNLVNTDREITNAQAAEPLRQCLRVIDRYMGNLAPVGVCLDVVYVNTAPKLSHDLQGETQRAQQALSNTGIIGSARFRCVGREQLHDLYYRAQWSSAGSLTFAESFAIPPAAGIAQARFGIVRATDLMKLLCDDHGRLNESLFSDNVRGYQLTATVNDEIRQTLDDGQQRQQFAVLNNGVTIVANDLWPRGKSAVTMRDFQVVNGCQTCHVLAENAATLDGVFVPVRLVECESEEVVDRVIMSTNRQTSIPKEYITNRISLIRRLVDYYRGSQRAGRELYFKDRPGTGPNTLRRNVVTLPAQLNAYIAMFGNRPPIRSHTNLDKDFGKLFAQALEAEFYTAGAALYRWDWLVESKRMAGRYRPLGYAALAVIGVLNRVRPLWGPAKQKKKRLEPIDVVIWSDGQWERLSHTVQPILDEALDRLAIADMRNAASSKRFADTVVEVAARHVNR